MKNYMHLDEGKLNEPFAVAGAEEVFRYFYIFEIEDMDEGYATVADFIMMYQGR